MSKNPAGANLGASRRSIRNLIPSTLGVVCYLAIASVAGEPRKQLTIDQDGTTSNAEAGNKAVPVSLLDGKLKIDIPSDFSREPDNPADPKTVAKFSRKDGAWGEVLRGAHGLTPDGLNQYLAKRVAEYSKGFDWLPKGYHLQWLRKEIVTIDGRKWADWRYVPMANGSTDYQNNPVYTRFLTTSYQGQLLEITFTTNLTTDPGLKEEIERIMESVHLEE